MGTEKEDDQRKLKTKLVEDEKINKSRKDQAETPSKSKDKKDIDDEEEVVGRKKVKNKPSEDEKIVKSKKEQAETDVKSKSDKDDENDESPKVLKTKSPELEREKSVKTIPISSKSTMSAILALKKAKELRKVKDQALPTKRVPTPPPRSETPPPKNEKEQEKELVKPTTEE